MTNAVLVCRICVKYRYTIRAVCAYACVFRKRPGCALIGACALIRMNTVCCGVVGADVPLVSISFVEIHPVVPEKNFKGFLKYMGILIM